MASYNKVILIGNLTRDVNVRQTPKGTSIGDMSLAINSSWFDKATNSKREETTYVDVTLWGRHADLAAQYLAKGSSVMIEGRLKLDSWDDKQTGQKRSKLGVVCEEMQFIGGKSDGQSGGQSRGQSRPRQSVPTAEDASAFDEFPQDEVPF